MADGTAIAWAHATINAISGCTPVSPGCTNCYAMRAGGHKRPHHPSNGLTQPSRAGHVWTGAVRLNEDWLRKPLSWTKPRRIFWNAHGDPWHESVPFEWVDREMAVAALTPQHRHLFLTKRSGRMRRYFDNPATPERILEAAKQLKALPASWTWPLPNVWLGVSVEDQPRWDERVEDLESTPAAIRFVSIEPALGPIDGKLISRTLRDSLAPMTPEVVTAIHNVVQRPFEIRSMTLHCVDWVIVGGESGQGARPVHPDWVRSLRDQCAKVRVPFLFKQWGDWLPYGHIDAAGNVNTRDRGEKPGLWHDWGSCWSEPDVDHFSVRIGKRAAGRLLDGVLHDAYPELFAWEIAERAARLKELADA